MIEPFPPECPPEDAEPKPGLYFRLARRGLIVGQPTTADCWLRPYETRRSELEGRADLPEAHGLSVFASRDDLSVVRDIVPILGRKPVAAVEIRRHEGRLRVSPMAATHGQSHHDWWTEPHDLIPVGQIVEEGRTD